ncbi:MAG: glutamate formimidoyltransferase [Coriobacteriia bacterium]|nr:glutamate formimidoyltransferase [Coriobacteriia bacterium]
MQKIIESIPNFSVSSQRDPETFDKLVNTAGPTLKSTQSDGDHNRCVFTLIGEPEKVGEAIFNLATCAAENIDLRHHTGEHPRIGATDVIPFVPIKDATMDECIDLSIYTAKRISSELNIPTFLYEYSTPERRNLADIRLGKYAKPDFGPDQPHPTAGATVVGARKFLIAYNVNLDTDNIHLAKKIASLIREKNGGYPGIKALGMKVNGRAQVSMNICDFEATGVREIFDVIAKLAPVKNSELIGMAPAATNIEADAEHLKLADFDPQKQIIDYQI